eukprot:TRINITY_DN30483_c0_g1_i2.p1 TRINITY_DN30483_c0_g1~~TRINITY_DN30483_c0_g1_i2.p1  ORF type:complete len:442 (+),score=60.98 TRINITY_DN30483_c0_g1_i2:38-1363(+)
MRSDIGVKLLLVVGVLVFGSFNVLNMKWQFDVCAGLPSTGDQVATTCPDGLRVFNKPWAQNWLMFWGEFWILGVYGVQRRWSDRRRRLSGRPPRADDGANPLVFAVPALCDVVGSGLSAVGLLLVPASIYQMMRSSTVVFTAILTVTFLRKRLLPYRWLGVAVTVAGLSCVGCAAVLDSKTNASAGSSHMVSCGMCLIVIGQLAGAFQGVFEEHLMQGLSVSAKKTLGMEGLWGVIFMGLLLIVFANTPGKDNGVVENFADTLSMWQNSGTLQMLSFTYILSVGLCNICCFNVTKRISAMTRCLVDCCRTIVVWLVSLALYYSGHQAWGAPWTAHSSLQLCGFLLLILGTLLYNGAVRVPGFKYELSQDPISSPPAAAAWSPKFTLWKRGLDDWEFSQKYSPSATPCSTPLLDETARFGNGDVVSKSSHGEGQDVIMQGFA